MGALAPLEIGEGNQSTEAEVEHLMSRIPLLDANQKSESGGEPQSYRRSPDSALEDPPTASAPSRGVESLGCQFGRAVTESAAVRWRSARPALLQSREQARLLWFLLRSYSSPFAYGSNGNHDRCC